MRTMTKGTQDRIYLQVTKGSILQYPKLGLLRYNLVSAVVSSFTDTTSTKGRVY